MKTFAECCISEAHICIAHTEQLKYSIPDTSSNNTVKTVAEWINLIFFLHALWAVGSSELSFFVNSSEEHVWGHQGYLGMLFQHTMQVFL